MDIRRSRHGLIAADNLDEDVLGAFTNGN